VKVLTAMQAGDDVGLIGRATDVILQERCRSFFVPQEKPLSETRLDQMLIRTLFYRTREF
jgi:3-polyprenyl-4-hydroxybenzoate decarboxylase